MLAYPLACLALASPWLSGRVTIPWDAKAEFYPQFAFLARSLHAGDSPFWTPNIFAGHPQIADPQSLIFSPPHLLAALLIQNPGFAVFDAIALGMLALGGLAVLLLCRDLRWHPAGGVVAALAFAFGGSAAWRLQHIGQVLSLAWFGIALWLLARALSRGSAVYGALAGLSAGCMVLGRDQVALLGVYVLTGQVIWHLAEPHWLTIAARLRAALAPLLAGLVAGICTIAIPLAFTLALALDSNRPSIDFAGAEKGSLHPASLLTLAIPNLFGTDGPLADFWGPPSMIWGPTDLYLARNMGDLYAGALPLAALLLAGRALWGASFARFALIALSAVLAYALGRYTPAFQWLFLLPGADLYRRPADATFILGALLAVLAGFAVHLQCSAPGRSCISGALLAAAVFAASAALAVAKGTVALALWPWCEALGFAIAAFAALAAMSRWPRAATMLAALFMTLDLAANNGPNESTALPPGNFAVLEPGSSNATLALLRQKLREGAAPDRRDRVELAAIDFHWPNAGLVHDLDHDLGYNPVRLALFTAATNAADHVAVPDQRQWSPLFARYRSPLADLLGLRWIATGVPAEEMDRQLQDGDLMLVARTQEAFVYENPRALPRAMLATQAQAADFSAMLASGQWPDADFRRTVLLPPESVPAAQPSGGSGSARILSYRNTQIVVEADAPQGGWLVLGDIWHPWWAAKLDGRRVPVLRANVMFRAIALPPGTHRIRFSFEPFAGLWRQLRGR